jgi:large subunit ribosomal protein L24
MVSIQPRKARKRLYSLPVHLARREISSHLSDDLIKKYDRRTIVLRKGDTVTVMRGDFRGTSGKILEVDVRARKVQVEGVTVTKADKTQKPRPIAASNLLVTKLDLSDKIRRDAIGEKEAPPEPKPPRKTPKAKAAESESDAEDETQAREGEGGERPPTPASADEEDEAVESGEEAADEATEEDEEMEESQ